MSKSQEKLPLLNHSDNIDHVDEEPRHSSLHYGSAHYGELVSPHSSAVYSPPSATINYDSSPEVEERPASLGIMYLTVFISSLGFSIVLPSLAFYVQALYACEPKDQVCLAEATEFLGWVVAVYSLGQLLGSLVFGSWSQRRRTVEPLIVSLIISALANFYYAMAEDIPPFHVQKYHVLVARFLVGFGAGNVSLCRAFASEATTLAKRNQAMTIMGAAQGVGFVLGPAIGFALTFIGPVGLKGGIFTLDEFTSAGFVSCLLILVNVAILPCTFRDIPGKSNVVQKKKKCSQMFTGKGEALAMIFVIWIFFVVLSGFSIFETITGPLTEHYLGFESQKNGLLVLGAGVLAVFVFVVMGIFTRKKFFNDRLYIAYGLLVLTTAFVGLTPFKELPLGQLLAGTACVGMGYPVASTMTYALFSKVIGPEDQGDKMGFLTAAGSLARMVGPIWATVLYGATPKEPGLWLFPVIALLHAITAILFFIFWKKMVPHEAHSLTTSIQ